MIFVKPYQSVKPIDVVEFIPSIDVTDQRAVVQSAEQMYNRFLVDPSTFAELQAETVEDFNRDVYDYEDRSEYGVDVVTASNLKQDDK